jgi:hypothetical protein
MYYAFVLFHGDWVMIAQSRDREKLLAAWPAAEIVAW